MVGAAFTGSSATAWAGHCEYCNEGLPSDAAVKTTEIGTDGVIVLRLVDARDRVLDARFWDITTVTVTDAEGAVLEGTLEPYPGFVPAAWRPAQPWTPGTYEVTVAVDRTQLVSPDPTCHDFTHRASVTVVDGPRHDGGVPTVVVSEDHRVEPHRSLDTLVCCDGSWPLWVPVPGSGCPGYPERDLIQSTYCHSLEGTGQLVLDARVQIDGGDASADYSIRELTQERTASSGDPRMNSTFSAPACVEYEVLDLVTGERSLQPVVKPSRRHNTAPAARAFVPHRLLAPGQRPLRASARAALTAF